MKDYHFVIMLVKSEGWPYLLWVINGVLWYGMMWDGVNSRSSS